MVEIENGFEPKIMVFVNSWYTRIGGDHAKSSRFQYPSTIRIMSLVPGGEMDYR